jgi:hypothetical protein
VYIRRWLYCPQRICCLLDALWFVSVCATEWCLRIERRYLCVIMLPSLCTVSIYTSTATLCIPRPSRRPSRRPSPRRPSPSSKIMTSTSPNIPSPNKTSSRAARRHRPMRYGADRDRSREVAAHLAREPWKLKGTNDTHKEINNK